MEIPKEIRDALRTCGLSADKWRVIRTAFHEFNPPDPIEEAARAELVLVANGLFYAADELRAMAESHDEKAVRFTSEFFDGKTWEQLQEQMFRCAWKHYGVEGIVDFASRFGIGKTTIYRWMKDYKISFREHKEMREFISIAAVTAEIARLKNILATMTENAEAA